MPSFMENSSACPLTCPMLARINLTCVLSLYSNQYLVSRVHPIHIFYVSCKISAPLVLPFWHNTYWDCGLDLTFGDSQTPYYTQSVAVHVVG